MDQDRPPLGRPPLRTGEKRLHRGLLLTESQWQVVLQINKHRGDRSFNETLVDLITTNPKYRRTMRETEHGGPHQ